MEEGEEWVDGGGVGGGTTRGPKQKRQDVSAKKTETGEVRDVRKAEGIMFVPYTMGGKLRSRLQNEDDKLTRIMRMP